MSSLYAEPAATFEYKLVRTYSEGVFSGAHQDTVYFGNASERMVTAWVPLGDLPLQQGGLCIASPDGNSAAEAADREMLRRVHASPFGRREGWEGAEVHGSRYWTTDPLELAASSWRTSSFQMGDVLLFNSTTLHMSTANTTGNLRISADVRFQPATDPAPPLWPLKNVEPAPGESVLPGHFVWQEPMCTTRLTVPAQ